MELHLLRSTDFHHSSHYYNQPQKAFFCFNLMVTIWSIWWRWWQEALSLPLRRDSAYLCLFVLSCRNPHTYTLLCIHSICTSRYNTTLRVLITESLIIPFMHLYVVEIPQSDLNGIRQLHKQQLKAWLSLFFLITSEVASCIQSSSAITNVCWCAFVMIKASFKIRKKKIVSFPPTTQ